MNFELSSIKIGYIFAQIMIAHMHPYVEQSLISMSLKIG